MEEHKEAITTKGRMYELQRMHMLGNSLDTWDYQTARWMDTLPEYVYIRGRQRGMELVESVHKPMLGSMIARYCSVNKCSISDVVIGEAAIGGGRRLFQGEVWVQGPSPQYPEWWRGLVLHYSTEDVNMREAAARGWRCHQGLLAVFTLHTYLSYDEYDELSRLLDEWPGAVIEFTLFESPVGWLHERLCIWEIRHY